MLNQTPIQNKIEEFKRAIRLGGEIDANLMAFAQYIKEEIVPETRIGSREDVGFNYCRNEVVDKFKEMGI